MERDQKLGREDHGGRTVRGGRIVAIVLMLSLAGTAGPVLSQVQAPAGTAQSRAPFTPDQLDQLLAPIALYPDPLLGQILMAATYPLEVVHAARWLNDPTHAALTSVDLATALDLQPWDPSVKALVPFPDILRTMEASLDWTEAVGDAFLADEAAVMDAVQRLRQRAQSAGTLVTTAQQTVSAAEGAVVVMPATPDTVYVPTYDPRVVYGTWVYAPYPPYGFPPPVVYPFGGPVVGGLSFGVGIAIVAPLWGWSYWDWPHHHLHVDVDRFGRVGGYHPPPGGVWQHDPGHRHGVPYRDPGTRVRFPGPPQGDVRGYGTHVLTVPGLRPRRSVGTAPRPAPPAPAPGGGAPKGAVGGALSGLSPRPVTKAAPAPGGGAPKILSPVPGGPVHPAPPAFESFGRGADVRTQTDRGQSSRHTIAPQSRVPVNPPRPGAAPTGASHPGAIPPPGSGKPRR